MKKIGFILLLNQNNGGVLNYSLSLIQQIQKLNSISEIIIFTDNVDFNYGKLRVRKIKRNSNKVLKILEICCLIFGYRRLYARRKNLINLTDDIDEFFVPYIDHYPHFHLNKPFYFTLHDLQ